jgi:hypothetical protein
MRITIVKKAATKQTKSLPYCPWMVHVPTVNTK